jgi:SAM-dependent methyltransferase
MFGSIRELARKGMRMKYCPEIFDRFKGALESDKAQYAPVWMTRWAYQDKRDRRSIRYPENYPQEFYTYHGPPDLVKWFNFHTEQPKPDYFPDAIMAPLVELSHAGDQRILKEHGLEFDWTQYPEHIGRYNAQDYILQNFYPVPPRFAIHRVLDFGAGYGRQANLWIQKHSDLVFVGMDAVPLSYCLQHLYYSGLPGPLWDYALSPSDFAISTAPGLYHLPTWRTDLLPDSFFDLIIGVQVLQELNARLLSHMIGVFQRVLKPGGACYIRDHECWPAGHRKHVSRLLSDAGFVLEFKPHVQDKRDIHGIPRVWRKVDPEVQASLIIGRRQRLAGYFRDIDAALHGLPSRACRKLTGSGGA